MIPDFDWMAPDYTAVFRERAARLARLRTAIAEETASGRPPTILRDLKRHYRANIPQFITDWGCTFDPRNVRRGLPSVVPFMLFPKQVEWIEWALERWRDQEPGLTEKSRESGLSWLAVAMSCGLCALTEGMAIGFGSRKEEYVDRRGDMKSLFEKGRRFMALLPVEFRAGWTQGAGAHMRMSFPDTGSVMTGEAGDNIGRGDRQSIYIVDEAAFLEHPDLVDASLSQTTNCRLDISTPNGGANSFALKRQSGKIKLFTFHWRDDPRKDEAWYEKQKLDIDNSTIIAQELDIDYAASVEGVLIPAEWVRASIDAHLKLGIAPTGAKRAALDVADEGADTNAICGSRGPLVELVIEKSGKGSDIFGTVEWAFLVCDENDYPTLRYDADGLGAGVRGDARIVNDRRRSQNARIIDIQAFRGSEAPHRPEAEDVKGRKNQDFFSNRKAQAWWALRVRFQNTFRAIQQIDAIARGELAAHERKHADPDTMIFLSSKCGNIAKLTGELSQPTFSLNVVGKVVVDKTPEGARSPNMADAVMIDFAGLRAPLLISAGALAEI
jgi:phage terminase large subunit